MQEYGLHEFANNIPPFFATSAESILVSLINSVPVAHKITHSDYIAVWVIDWLVRQEYNVSVVMASCER
jgi:hypothetical protein